jgi:tRNA (cytidine32/uridine32-2'-O)-methyltransferase
MIFDHVRVVLVHPSHAGNIGASARAMKTMRLNRLYLVRPKSFPDSRAVMMASGANDVLSNALVVDNFEQAIADCHWVVGTTARKRTLNWSVKTPKQAAAHIVALPKKIQIALVFGCEQWGLTNEQLIYCHQLISIPTDEIFSSLNLAAAVQIMSYELHVAYLFSQARPPVSVSQAKLATTHQVSSFYQRLECLLKAIQFSNIYRSKQLIRRMKRLFNRVQLEAVEVNILQGIISTLYKRLGLKE